MTKNKNTYLYDVLNLKTEKEPIEIPKAKMEGQTASFNITIIKIIF